MTSNSSTRHTSAISCGAVNDRPDAVVERIGPAGEIPDVRRVAPVRRPIGRLTRRQFGAERGDSALLEFGRIPAAGGAGGDEYQGKWSVFSAWGLRDRLGRRTTTETYHSSSTDTGAQSP